MAQVEEQVEVPVLQGTRDLFAATHWGKGAFAYYEFEETDAAGLGVGSGKQKYCAVGGLRFKSGHEPEQSDTDDLLDDPAYARALLVLVEALAEEYPEVRDRVRVSSPPGCDMRRLITDPVDEHELRIGIEICQDAVIAWNDVVTRTSNEVVFVFDKALAKAKATTTRRYIDDHPDAEG